MGALDGMGERAKEETEKFAKKQEAKAEEKKEEEGSGE